MKFREWKYDNAFNPFNSFKIMAHLERWSQIDIPGGVFPPPVAVTVDPTNRCNYACLGCNAAKVKNKGIELSGLWVHDLMPFLSDWGVKAVTFAGGGEPLLHPEFGTMVVDSCQNQMETALITNGYHLDRWLTEIRDSALWVGVSVDAGTPKTYAMIKGIDEECFSKVIKNILTLTRIGVNVTYKYLVNKHNIEDIAQACRVAMESGCSSIHIRPIGTTWFDEPRPVFSKEEVERTMDAVDQARADLESDAFRIYGVTHKFGDNWKIKNCFRQCWSAFMYLVICPGGIITPCCDNRGNKALELASGLERPIDILSYWGSKEHVDMFNRIDVSKCPRCTFTIHNQCYENCVIRDNMFVNFI